MFRCQNCDRIVPAGVRSNKIVVQIRRKEYAARGPDPSERRRYPRGRGPRKKQKYDRGGAGHEIVREIMVCPECAKTVVPATPPEKVAVGAEEEPEESAESES